MDFDYSKRPGKEVELIGENPSSNAGNFVIYVFCNIVDKKKLKYCGGLPRTKLRKRIP